MSIGIWLSLGTVVALLTLMGLAQAAMAWRGRQQLGKAAPVLDGLPTVGPALVYFYSPTCGPCRAMSPMMRALATEGRAVLSIDVTTRPDVAAAFSVMATPTTVAVRDGTIRDVLIGAAPRGRLEPLLA